MIEPTELIERWSNVARVLDTMPAHERKKHWDMGDWGRMTDCGTVACAAGHCGLDPWFRERGFKLEFEDVTSVGDISDVPEFFGLEGSNRIFYNSTKRPVEKVLGEVREYLGELEQLRDLVKGRNLPAIGEMWPEQGGVYAGPRLGVKGKPNYLLIIGPEHADQLDWHDAHEWATKLEVAGHTDFDLPDRNDGVALFDRVPRLFKRECYWLEQHESGSYDAWNQTFDYGTQGTWVKGGKLRARAVRRLPL